MAMGKRKQRQELLFILADELPQSEGHPFYQKLNSLLTEADFDRWIEQRCVGFYEQEETRGQPSVPPGVYFRMLLVGYFEDISSQRGIAWRCGDNRRRMARAKGKRLQRLRSERVERSFAHVCETGARGDHGSAAWKA